MGKDAQKEEHKTVPNKDGGGKALDRLVLEGAWGGGGLGREILEATACVPQTGPRMFCCIKQESPLGNVS